MATSVRRRTFLSTLLAGGAGLVFSPSIAKSAEDKPFSFLVLGDLHYDKLEHHDLAWLEKEKPDDLRQVRDYSRITAEIEPRLLSTLRESVQEVNRSAQTRVAFTAQLGDLVEGLCGNEALARKQDTDAVELIRGAGLGMPFLFTKGNHDITGPGAADAFKQVFHPFLSQQVGALTQPLLIGNAGHCCWSFQIGDAVFCFYDAYSKESLPWLENTLAAARSRHIFVLLHTPVVPYGARSTWHIFSAEKDQALRDRLLAVLGEHRAIVLTGHIHRYSVLVRATAGAGRFLQLALCSVISTPEPKPKTVLSGVADYNPDQVKVEPTFSPSTEAQRRLVYQAEAPFVKQFEYADMPGYAVVNVAGDHVSAKVYSGATKTLWRDLDLTKLLAS